MPAFNMLVQKDLSLGMSNPAHIGALLIIVLICGLVAGSYPSFYLSSFNPVFVLKGVRLKTGSAAWIRKGLVVAQFTVSLVLIVSTLAERLCLSHNHQRMGVCMVGYGGDIDSPGHHQLSIGQSGPGEPGKEFKNGVNHLALFS